MGIEKNKLGYGNSNPITSMIEGMKIVIITLW
jgi:hypothetical protein